MGNLQACGFQLQYPGDPAEGLQELLLKLLTSNSMSLVLNDASLLTLLDGMEGLELLMGLLTTSQSAQEPRRRPRFRCLSPWKTGRLQRLKQEARRSQAGQ